MRPGGRDLVGERAALIEVVGGDVTVDLPPAGAREHAPGKDAHAGLRGAGEQLEAAGAEAMEGG